MLSSTINIKIKWDDPNLEIKADSYFTDIRFESPFGPCSVLFSDKQSGMYDDMAKEYTIELPIDKIIVEGGYYSNDGANTRMEEGFDDQALVTNVDALTDFVIEVSDKFKALFSDITSADIEVFIWAKTPEHHKGTRVKDPAIRL